MGAGLEPQPRSLPLLTVVKWRGPSVSHAALEQMLNRQPGSLPPPPLPPPPAPRRRVLLPPPISPATHQPHHLPTPARAEASTEELSEKYTDVMQERMGSAVLTYRHEDGTNFCRILDDLIVGSCLQRVEDLDRRAAAAGCGSSWGLGMGLGMGGDGLPGLPLAGRCASRVCANLPFLRPPGPVPCAAICLPAGLRTRRACAP